MSESERVQLARSLHDGIAQELVALSYRIQLIEMRSDLSPELSAEMRDLHSSISTLSQSIRDELLQLRQPQSQSISQELQELIASSQFSGEFLIENSTSSLPRALCDALIELTRNAINHARASRIEISITNDDGYAIISIRDNGIGGAGVRDGHYGLLGIKESIESIKGEFELFDDGGTLAWIKVPLVQS